MARPGDRQPEPEIFQARAWRRISAPGTTYTPRTGHTCVVWKNYIYVFGGTDKRRRQQDMFRFDLRAQVWEPVPARGDVPMVPTGGPFVPILVPPISAPFLRQAMIRTWLSEH